MKFNAKVQSSKGAKQFILPFAFCLLPLFSEEMVQFEMCYAFLNLSEYEMIVDRNALRGSSVMAKVLYLNFLQLEQQVLLGRNTIAGRSRSKCNLILSDYFQGNVKTISSRHFKIACWESGEFVIIDMGSVNGTRLNGEKLVPYVERILRDGDIIQVGKRPDFRIQVVLEEASNDATFMHSITDETMIDGQIQTLSGIMYDEKQQCFFVDGLIIPNHYLSAQERDLLNLLYRHKETVCQFYEIEMHVWGVSITRDTLRQKVRSLRNKLDDISEGAGRRYIHSVHGYGYKYSASECL